MQGIFFFKENMDAFKDVTSQQQFGMVTFDQHWITGLFLR